ncbi:Translation Initiation factor eIF- 4e [Neofusicoccum parvum]|nr:Translation Initiation factor eIF- 4e [Neofusicoccum parvum]
MPHTTVCPADERGFPVYSDITGLRCIQILNHIDELSDLSVNPPRSVDQDPKQFDHLQALVRAFAAFKADFEDTAELRKPSGSQGQIEPQTEPQEPTKPEEQIELQEETEYEEEFESQEEYDYQTQAEYLQQIKYLEQIQYEESTMAARPSIPGLTTNGLPTQSDSDAAANASPARGKQMKEALLQKLRPPPLEHTWEFWHDRQGRESKPAWAQAEEEQNTNPDSPADKLSESIDYESRLVKLHVIKDLRQFWETMNHFELGTLRLRDSVHLFHLGVKPVWEDPRNLKGGAWTFRVPKEKAAQFWKEVALMAIGGKLQSAVDNSAKRHTFIDDICGISYSVRFNSHLISIWNRDAENQEGIDRLREAVLGSISPELQLRDNQFYYKRHSEHAGFRFPPAGQEAGAQ